MSDLPLEATRVLPALLVAFALTGWRALGAALREAVTVFFADVLRFSHAFATAARDGREELLALTQCTALCDRLIPVWFGDGRSLLFSDIPNNRILRWDEATGQTSVFRQPSNNANGHTRDRRGRLIACEHDARRVVRFEYDGAITVLADSYNGKPLNSPNDVVVKSDGSVWFSDPTFGILGYYEGHKAPSENKPAVYRLDPATGDLLVREAFMIVTTLGANAPWIFGSTIAALVIVLVRRRRSAPATPSPQP